MFHLMTIRHFIIIISTACMYMYVYVCMYMYMYACMYVCIYVCTHFCLCLQCIGLGHIDFDCHGLLDCRKEAYG